jgi:hypothetical protein
MSERSLNKECIRRGINLNASIYCDQWDVKQCKEFIDASGGVSGEDELKFGNLHFNLWKVAKRLAELVIPLPDVLTKEPTNSSVPWKIPCNVEIQLSVNGVKLNVK